MRAALESIAPAQYCVNDFFIGRDRGLGFAIYVKEGNT